MTTIEIAITIAIVALVTLVTRALPFFVFGADRPLPPYIRYLNTVLPTAVIAMLVVYCLKGTSLMSAPYGMPELISLAFLTIVHRRYKKMLVSIGGSTALYMILVQKVFA
ncbi:MAG: AzlD domain-containing protein [Selenomonadales bacterium]|nr:AzlD domain-containing protein [Selenomonadales bacterium]